MHNLTVVSGLYRSGSSMMMQILEDGGIDPIYHYLNKDQHNENGYYEIDERRSERVYAEIIAGLYPDSCIKVLVPFIKKNKIIHLADRVIFIERDIYEVVDSTNKKWGYKPYNRALLKQLNEVKKFIDEQQIQSITLNYNEILDNPEQGLSPLKFFIDIEKAVSVVEERLYKTKNGKLFCR